MARDTFGSGKGEGKCEGKHEGPGKSKGEGKGRRQATALGPLVRARKLSRARVCAAGGAVKSFRSPFQRSC